MSQSQQNTDSPRSSKKRDHATFRYDLRSRNQTAEKAEVNGGPSKVQNKAGDEDGIEDEEEVAPVPKKEKPSLEPCWACRLEGKECDDNSSICHECFLDLTTVTAFGGCKRDNLGITVRANIPNIPGLGTSTMLLPLTDKHSLRCQLKYTNPDIEIYDLNHYLADTPILEKSTGAILQFLSQFHDINIRWGNWYEPITQEIITACAEIQGEILERTRPGRKPLRKEELLIASTFRALGLAQRIAEVDGNMSPGYDYIEEEDLDTSDPEIIISRVPRPPQHRIKSDGSFEESGGELRDILADVVETTQRLIMKRRPKDWPTIFCTLCCLKLVIMVIRPITFGGVTFSGVTKVEDVWERLCDLFFHVAKQHQPLAPNFSIVAYARIVGPRRANQAASYRVMQQIWDDGGFEEDSQGHEFKERLNNFVNGTMF